MFLRVGIAIGIVAVLALYSQTGGGSEASSARLVSTQKRTTLDRITYTTFQRASNWDIYLFKQSGQAPQRLTNDSGLDYDPVVSPDGRWLVFCSERRGSPDLYVLDLQAIRESPRLLVDSEALEDQAGFSPDGKSLVFVSTFSGNADIYLLPFQPGKTMPMTAAQNLTHHPGGDFRPAFSPDGHKIAFSSDRDLPVRAMSPIDRERSSDIYVVDIVTQNLHRLTDAPGWDGSPNWSADGKTIVFYSERSANPNAPLRQTIRQSKIWAMNADAANQHVVTPREVTAVSPKFLPNGRIIYSRRSMEGRWQIVSVSPDGSVERVDSDSSENDYRQPVVGPSTGSFVAYGNGPVTPEPSGGYRRSAGEADIFLEGPVLLSGAPFSRKLPDREVELYPIRYFAAVLHPTEDLILHMGPPGRASSSVFPELLTSTITGSAQQRLFQFDETQTEPLGFSWSKDGRWIAFTRGGITAPRVTPYPNADVWKMRANGTGLENLTPDSPGYDGHPSFSGDGRQMVFRSERTGQPDIYLMNADGTNVRNLTNDVSRDLFPVFSPTSSQIAFVSNRDSLASNLYEIYLMELNADGSPSQLHRVTHSDGQKGHLDFSYDGKWIIFASEEGGISDETPLAPASQAYGELYAYRIQDGTTVRLTHNKWEEGIPSWQPALHR